MSEQNLEENIGQIIDRFDFDRVHRVMTFLNLQWKEAGVPEIPELRNYAIDMIRRCIEGMQKNKEIEREFNICCNGFSVRTYQYDEGKVYIYLEFVLASLITTISA